MPHIHTNSGEHDHTASAYIILLPMDDKPARALLHRHKKIGMYLQFGGHIELTETPWAALAHELEEESGYKLSQFKVAQPRGKMPRLSKETVEHPVPISLHTHPFPIGDKHFHTDSGFLLVTNQQPDGTPDDHESDDIREFTSEDLKNLSNDEIYENVRIQFLWGLELVENGNEFWELIDTSEYQV